MPRASPISWTLSWPGVGALPATDSSPLPSASSHRASMSPPERIGFVSVCSRRRSASFREPADTSGIDGSRLSSIPSRFWSVRSSSFQSMSFSVLSIFQLLTHELKNAVFVPLPPHQIGFVHINSLPVVKEGNEDRQSDCGLCCGNGHHEKDKDEAVELMELPGIREKGQIHRVHHQLDGHEDRDAVAASEHAADADGEQDRAQDQKPLSGNHGHRAATPRALSSSAPTIAASRRID